MKPQKRIQSRPPEAEISPAARVAHRRPGERAANDEEIGRLVTISELARDMGMSEGAIRNRIAKGIWIEGTHFYRRGRRIRMVLNACRIWWTQHA